MWEKVQNWPGGIYCTQKYIITLLESLLPHTTTKVTITFFCAPLVPLQFLIPVPTYLSQKSPWAKISTAAERKKASTALLILYVHGCSDKISTSLFFFQREFLLAFCFFLPVWLSLFLGFYLLPEWLLLSILKAAPLLVSVVSEEVSFEWLLFIARSYNMSDINFLHFNHLIFLFCLPFAMASQPKPHLCTATITWNEWDWKKYINVSSSSTAQERNRIKIYTHTYTALIPMPT